MTVGAAVAAIQSMNGGSSDGATIYLFEGSYSLGSGSVSTTKEWITITKDQSGRKDYTIINNAGTAADTTYMRFADITLQGSSSGVRYLGRSPAILWIDDCIIQGGGRWVINAHPAIRSGDDENTIQLILPIRRYLMLIMV